MEKRQKFELLCVKVCWALIIVGFLSALFFHIVKGNFISISLFTDTISLVIISVLNFVIHFTIKRQKCEKNYINYFSRLIEAIIILVVASVVLDKGQWSLIFVLFPVAAAIIASCILIYKYNMKTDEDNKCLLMEYKEKCEQLTADSDEIKQKYIAIQNEKCELEGRNRELLSSVAEYFTLQQVSQAITSTLDIRELLKFVNDIIIGVMGVSHSTVVFYDEKNKRLKVSITSVSEHNELAVLTDNINNLCLLEALENDKEIIENNVDPAKYKFTKGRDVKSLICVPINAKSRKFGLVVAEQKFQNAFNQNNARILSIIGQQVGFAMENADLYQKMQELATIDGLTGIYNRHYFHDRLQKEFQNAVEENYDLSLVIFDIDHFKKFNDTYGHLFGDKVLKTIVEELKGCLRSSDIFARFGGEEFIILFPMTNLLEASEKADMLRDTVSRTIIKNELETVKVTMSFGVASFPENASTENELIRLADDALYEAKNSGRNCVAISKVLRTACNNINS